MNRRGMRALASGKTAQTAAVIDGACIYCTCDHDHVFVGVEDTLHHYIARTIMSSTYKPG